MVIEYANKREDTQHILRPLVLTLFMYVARQYNDSCTAPVCHCLSDRIVQYMAAHSDVVTLKDIAAHFPITPTIFPLCCDGSWEKLFPKSCWNSGWKRVLPC